VRGPFGPQTTDSATRPKTRSEARILATLQQMRTTGNIRFGVPEADGRKLRLLAEAVGAKNVIEIGTSTGYSTFWLCLGVQHAGGHVTTFDLDEKVASIAREHFRRAGVDEDVTVVVGNAHATLASQLEMVDLVFLDADKEGCVGYLNRLLPLLRPGGIVLAHNIQPAPEFLSRVTADPSLDTVRLTQASGLSARLKKRPSLPE
jgi:predicted O-methyltransferase YrrM